MFRYLEIHQKFCIWQVLFSRGPMVELLISSDIAKYCEFRTVTRVLTNLEGKLEQVKILSGRKYMHVSQYVPVLRLLHVLSILCYFLFYHQLFYRYHAHVLMYSAASRFLWLRRECWWSFWHFVLSMKSNRINTQVGSTLFFCVECLDTSKQKQHFASSLN